MQVSAHRFHSFSPGGFHWCARLGLAGFSKGKASRHTKKESVITEVSIEHISTTRKQAFIATRPESHYRSVLLNNPARNWEDDQGYILQMNIPVSRIRFNPDRHDRQRKQMGEREGGSGPERTGELWQVYRFSLIRALTCFVCRCECLIWAVQVIWQLFLKIWDAFMKSFSFFHLIMRTNKFVMLLHFKSKTSE